MELKDFSTLEDAKSYTVTTYRKISGNEARQFFSMFGAIKALEALVNDAAVVQVIPNVNTTIGELAQAVLGTMNASNSQFATDPNTNDGMLNRVAADKLRLAGAFVQTTVDAFFNLSIVTEVPFKDCTLHELLLAKGTCPLVPVTPTGGYVVIETNADCEKHNPRLTVSVTSPRTGKTERIRIASFYNVSSRGLYETAVPSNWVSSEIFVDDAYNVVI